jgi:hypothetical protein
MMNWEEYIQEEEQKAHEARLKAQNLINQFGVPLDELAEIAKLEVAMIDPDVRQQIEMATGTKFDSVPTTKPRASASSYRQRGRSIAV